jgi:hypothetical protein
MNYLEEEFEKEYECDVCGKPINSPGLCESNACFNSVMM